jgi:hypothetical protein
VVGDISQPNQQRGSSDGGMVQVAHPLRQAMKTQQQPASNFIARAGITRCVLAGTSDLRTTLGNTDFPSIPYKAADIFF